MTQVSTARSVGSSTCSVLACLFVCASCGFGDADIVIGHHAEATGAAGSSVGGSMNPSSGACTLPGASGDATYAVGEAGQLEGALRFKAFHSGKCIAPRDCAPHGEHAVEQRSCVAEPCQIWQTRTIEPGWFSLMNMESVDCLDDSGSNLPDGNPIIASDCHLHRNQQWQAICAGDDRWKIVSRESGKLLTVSGGSPDDGAALVQQTDEGLAEQTFRLTLRSQAYASILETSEVMAQTWRVSTELVAADWASPAFDDSSWVDAPGAFGDNSGELGAGGTRWVTPDIWLRREFLVDVEPQRLTLRVHHHGDTQIYLNGVQAFSALGRVNAYRTSDVPAEALANVTLGRNVLAVHSSLSSSGALIDVGLGVFDFN